MKRNRYTKALKHLKSTKIDEKLQVLNEVPTNNTAGVYGLNPSGYKYRPKDPAKVFVPDKDGNWPAGVPGVPGESTYTRPEGWWDNDADWDNIVRPRISPRLIGEDGKSTEGLIADDGTVQTALPPGTRHFILGPLVDAFVPNHGYDGFLNIGYIQKDTRAFVLLARIDGQWEANHHNATAPVWDGTSTGFTTYNGSFTLEHAQWFRTQILNKRFTKNLPYNYSGGVPQSSPWPPAGGWPDWIPDWLEDLLDGMFGGSMPGAGTGGDANDADDEDGQPDEPGAFGDGETEPDTGDEHTQGDSEQGDNEDAGGPWPDNPDSPSNKPDSKSDTPDTPKSKKRKNDEQRARDHGLSEDRAAEMSDAELNNFNKLQDNLQADIDKFSAEEKAARKEMRDIAIGFGVDVALTLFGGAILKGGLKAASLGVKALKGKNILKASQAAAKASKAAQQSQINKLSKFGKNLKGAEKAEYLDDMRDLQYWLKDQPNQANVNKLFNKLNNPKNYGVKGGLINSVDDVASGTISQTGSKPFMHKTSGVKNIKTPKQVKNPKTGKMEFDVDVKNSKGEVIGKRFKSPDGKWYEVPNPYKTKGSSNPVKNIGDKLKWEIGERQVSSSQVSKWKQTGEPLKGWRPDRLITDPFGPGSTFSGPTSGAAKVLGGAAVVGAGAAIIKGIERFGNSGGFNKIEKMLSPKAVNINDPDLKSTVQEVEKELGKEAGEFVKNLVSKPAEELKSNMKKIRTDNKLIDPKRSDFPMGRSGGKQFAAAQKFSEVASPTSSVLTAGKVYLNYLIGNLPKVIDNNYLGDKFVNRAFKDAYINDKGTITVGDAVIGSGGKMKFDSKTNEVVLPFNYDFDTNEQAIMKEPDKYDARKVIPAAGMVAAWIVGGKYGIDSVPIPGAGYATWLSKSLGIGAEHRPGEIRMSVEKFKANNKTLYDRLVINGTIDDLSSGKKKSNPDGGGRFDASFGKPDRSIPVSNKIGSVKKYGKSNPGGGGRFDTSFGKPDRSVPTNNFSLDKLKNTLGTEVAKVASTELTNLGRPGFVGGENDYQYTGDNPYNDQEYDIWTRENDLRKLQIYEPEVYYKRYGNLDPREVTGEKGDERSEKQRVTDLLKKDSSNSNNKKSTSQQSLKSVSPSYPDRNIDMKQISGDELLQGVQGAAIKYILGPQLRKLLKQGDNVEDNVITESRSKILREIKKPVVVPELPKKYKMNFKGKFKAQNTPDVTASKRTSDGVKAQNAAGQAWREKDKDWARYESEERMNVVYDQVGHGEQAWDMIIDEAKKKNGWKNREIQEQLNIIAAEKAMRQIDPDYISPWSLVEQGDPNKDEIEIISKDPLVKRVAKRLKQEIDYPDKPSRKGYPDTPPKKQVDGWHPDYGKKYKYDKLDPVSADTMSNAPTGDPEIDSNVQKARKLKKKRDEVTESSKCDNKRTLKGFKKEKKSLNEMMIMDVEVITFEQVKKLRSHWGYKDEK